MNIIKNTGQRLRARLQKTKNEKGAALVEYIILLGLIGVVVIIAVLQLGGTVRDTYAGVTQTLSDNQSVASGETSGGGSSTGGGSGDPTTPSGPSGQVTFPPSTHPSVLPPGVNPGDTTTCGLASEGDVSLDCYYVDDSSTGIPPGYSGTVVLDVGNPNWDWPPFDSNQPVNVVILGMCASVAEGLGTPERVFYWNSNHNLSLPCVNQPRVIGGYGGFDGLPSFFIMNGFATSYSDDFSNPGYYRDNALVEIVMDPAGNVAGGSGPIGGWSGASIFFSDGTWEFMDSFWNDNPGLYNHSDLADRP